MTFIFRLYTSQELYQSTEQVHGQLNDLERVFPNSTFLKTQRALLFHHTKGMSHIRERDTHTQRERERERERERPCVSLASYMR